MKNPIQLTGMLKSCQKENAPSPAHARLSLDAFVALMEKLMLTNVLPSASKFVHVIKYFRTLALHVFGRVLQIHFCVWFQRCGGSVRGEMSL